MRVDRLAVGGAVLFLALMGPPQRTEALPKGHAAKTGVIDARAESTLRRMSDYLTGLRSFRVQTTTIDEMVTKDGQKIQQLQESRVILRRPNALRVDRVGPRGRVTFEYDGKQFAVASADKNIYAVEPAPPNLAAAIDTAREKLKIDAPGADLLVPRSYDSLTAGITTGRYIGLEPINGVMAHHLAVTKEDVDWQLWVQDGPQPFPLRFVITTKDLTAHPQFTVELRSWEPNAAAPDEMFSFKPAPGSRRVQFSAAVKTQPPG